MYAPTTIKRAGGRLVAMRARDYYDVNGVRDVRRVPRKAFDAIAKKWGSASALRHGSPRAGSGLLANKLLRAAGVRYILSETTRGLLPAPTESKGK